MRRFLVLLFLLFISHSAFGVTYYVSNSGDDTNSGLAGSPWKTITHALSSVAAGDRVNVTAGTYTTAVGVGETFPLNVTVPIYLVGDNATIEASGALSSAISFGVNGYPNNITTIEGFTINFNTSGIGFAVRQGCTTAVSNYHIRGNKINCDTSGSVNIGGVFVEPGDNSTINSLIENNRINGGYFGVSGDSGSANPRAIIQVKNSLICNCLEGVKLSRGIGVCTIEESTIFDNSVRGISIGTGDPAAKPTYNLLVKNTLLYGNGKGIEILHYTGKTEVINCTIANGGDGVSIFNNNDTNISVKNSNIAFNSGKGILLDTGFTGVLSNIFNDIYGNNTNYQGVSVGTGEISLDPLFISTAEGNYRVKSMTEGYSVHSFCIDTGDPADPYNNELPPNGARINMGAHGNTASAELSYVGPKTYYVNSATGNNTNIGLHPSYPWKNISYALTKVSTGDTVLVQAGTYNAAAGETFPYDIHGIDLKGQNATIEADLTSYLISLRNGANEFATLEGFTIHALSGPTSVNGVISYGGDAVDPTGGRTIKNNIIIGENTIGRAINGVIGLGYSGNVVIANNLIYGFTKGIVINGNSASTVGLLNAAVKNNTVSVLTHPSAEGITIGANTTAVVKNNIVTGGGTGISNFGSNSTFECIYNDAFGATYNFANIPTSPGNMQIDPSFISTAEANYRLNTMSSYCIDAGDPADDWSLEPTPNGGRINMGYLGNTANAELSRVGYRTYYVNSASGNNSNIGTNVTYPWQTITYALTRVATGDTLSLAGVMFCSAETFPLRIYNGITIEGSGTPEVTSVRGNLAVNEEVFIIKSPNVFISSLEVRGIGNLANGIAFNLADGGSALIKYVKVDGENFGSNAFLAATNSYLSVQNCAIKNMLHQSMRFAGTSSFEVINCTIVSGEESAINLDNQTSGIIRNSIIAFNNGFGIDAEGTFSGSLVNTYNDVYGNLAGNYNRIATGEGEISVDPLFRDSTPHIYRLQSISEGDANQSPCIDAGNPTDIWIMEPDPNGGRRNMGVYGGTPVAELSYSATTTTTTTTTTSTTTTTTTTGTTTTTRAIILPVGQIVVYPVVWRSRTDPPAKMAFNLTADQTTRLVICSSSGVIVFNNQYAAGSNGGRTGYNEILWDGKTPSGNYAGNGVYVVQLIAGSDRIAKGYITIFQ